MANESSPISCYVCNELEDKSCGDVFKSKDVHRQQCVNGEKYCRKIVQTGKNFVENNLINFNINFQK